MNCHCGEKCFSYQKMACPSSDGGERVITIVNKCQRLSDPKYSNPKKKKCDFYSENDLNTTDVSPQIKHNPKLNTPRINNHTDELMKNINLYRSCVENGQNFKNFAARIDYHLDALGYNYFNYSDETLDELVERISNDPDRIKHVIKKINMVSVPVIVFTSLGLPEIKKTRPRKKAQSKKKIQPKKIEIYTSAKKYMDTMDSMENEELKNKTQEETSSKIIDVEEDEDCVEESELLDHIEQGDDDAEAEAEETYEYKEDSLDDDDAGEFSD